MDILEVRDLRKSFGGIKAVDGIDFVVKRNEIFGIIGPNGAGKTTVFNLITGIYKPDSGSVKFKGVEVTRLKSYMVASLGIARTFQNLRLFKNLTVYENLLVGGLSKRNYPLYSALFRTKSYFKVEREVRKKVDDTLEFFELQDKKVLKAGTLPYGEQRKLELARALMIEPELILIDEPGAGMNPKEINDLARMILAIREKYGLTMIVIEHQMSLIMNISARIMVMDFGKKVMEGKPDEVKMDKRVIEAYLGEEPNA
ncbi:MAG: ABC transporter ATP-binding protein [Deltaproteobacteria bacterium]|nr:ABC transporter ATP-binding protein [Deltaproteobacteria bacterium]